MKKIGNWKLTINLFNDGFAWSAINWKTFQIAGSGLERFKSNFAAENDAVQTIQNLENETEMLPPAPAEIVLID